MSLKFGWYKTPVPSGREDKEIPHARVIPQGTIHTNQLCKIISEASSLSSADVKGVLEALNYWMGFYLSEGNSIELDGLGHFSPTLKSRTTTDDNGKQKVTVQADSVGFRCAVSLKEQIRNTDLEKVTQNKEKPLSPEERKKNILNFIDKNVSINSTKCMEINRCNRHVALQDLNELENEGKVLKTGSGKLIIFIKPYEQA
ncbi:HU family DNA-binding protein [Parabacteroides sp. AM08-6]|uniref:HU family DNA-binding protein n=1 Tax=Parabacteroides sp. AM08-6 TaxID=2292053 RepID=UPI000EFFB9AB|nr:HU family DNA-binding protein [Parabacteroides sp. AM08-6]RHJ78516.1 hypothetical protein DW103_14610 [Parabacteroides sp. AM08-6]